LNALFQIIIERHGTAGGIQKYGNLLMMGPSIQVKIREFCSLDLKNVIKFNLLSILEHN
jgi:hypothetical protein